MEYFDDFSVSNISALLNAGKIGVIRTDTLYGVLARADNEDAVERVYALKHRNGAKSPIVLIDNTSQLFDAPNQDTATLLNELWPGKVSIIMPSSKAPIWIRRGNNSVAYRMPNDKNLRELLALTGPLIAPSANPESLEPANSVQEAKDYFGDLVDFYVEGGTVSDNSPSQLIQINADGTKTRLR